MSMLHQLNYRTVRPAPSATPGQAAYFRQPLVQDQFAAIESLTVDEETKRELRAALSTVVAVLADLNQSVIEVRDRVDELAADLQKHIQENEWPST